MAFVLTGFPSRVGRRTDTGFTIGKWESGICSRQVLQSSARFTIFY